MTSDREAPQAEPRFAAPPLRRKLESVKRMSL
jgi:hypothetical protein